MRSHHCAPGEGSAPANRPSSHNLYRVLWVTVFVRAPINVVKKVFSGLFTQIELKR